MKHIRQFDRFAHSYDRHNNIQTQVARTLVQSIPSRPAIVADLGCGNGLVYKNIDWDLQSFFAVDMAPAMLQSHPEAPCVIKHCANFDDPELYAWLGTHPVEMLISASSLQWSRNIDACFNAISLLNIPAALAIFTAGTFQTLHATAGISSPIYPAQKVLDAADKHLRAETTLHRYKLHFDSTRAMLRHIKQSGVSGGKKKMEYAQLQKVLHEYPLTYLEFEVLFFKHLFD